MLQLTPLSGHAESAAGIAVAVEGVGEVAAEEVVVVVVVAVVGAGAPRWSCGCWRDQTRAKYSPCCAQGRKTGREGVLREGEVNGLRLIWGEGAGEERVGGHLIERGRELLPLGAHHRLCAWLA